MLPRIGRMRPEITAHQRGLARAVGADHRHGLAGVHLERDVEQRLEAAIAGVKRVQLKHPGALDISYARTAAVGLDVDGIGSEIHLDHPRIGRDLVRQTFGDLLAVVEHHHAIHHPHQHAHDVLDPDDGDAEFARMLRSMSAAWSISLSSRPPRLSSASSSFGSVASAFASSSFFSPAAPRPLTGAARSIGRPTMLQRPLGRGECTGSVVPSLP